MALNEYDLRRFERETIRAIDAFNNPAATAKRRKPSIASPPAHKGLRVQLAVRKGRFITNDVFTHDTDTLFKTDAVMRAERAARDAGYTKIAYTIDVTPIQL